MKTMSKTICNSADGMRLRVDISCKSQPISFWIAETLINPCAIQICRLIK
jgi:hypothetical protein